jgi:ribosome-associated toxin RatA of RatAB toxin-antitoxin module
VEVVVKHFAILGMIISFLIPSVSLAADKTSLDAKTRSELEKGKIITTIEQNPHTRIFTPTGHSLVEASAEEVWWVITDFNHFGEFMPNVVYYRPVGWKDGRLIVDCRVKVVMFKMDYTLSYVIDEKDHTTYWFYVKGPIKDAQGYFRIEPYDEKSVLVTYTTSLDIGKAIPGFIEETLGKTTFPSIFKSLKKRVALLKQKGPITKPVLPQIN